MENKFKKFFIIGLSGWLAMAVISLVNLKKILYGQCFFLNSWPFCSFPLSGWEKLEQALFLILIFLLIATPFIYLVKNENWKNLKLAKKQLMVIFLIISIFAIIAAPFTSSDVIYYYHIGRAVASGINPYLSYWTIENKFYFPQVSEQVSGVMYGPLTVYLFFFVYKIVLGSLSAFVITWKALMVILFYACSLLLMKIIRQEEDGANENAIWLWLFNPLVIWEWLVNGHFDAFWILPLLAAISFAYKKKWFLVSVVLTIGIWIKFIPIIITPLFILWWLKSSEKIVEKIKTAVFIILFFLFSTILFWSKFWGGVATIKPLIIQSKWALQSFFALIYYSLLPFFQTWLGDNAHYYLTRLVHLLLLVLVFTLFFTLLRNGVRNLFKKENWSNISYVNSIFLTLFIYLFVWQKSLWPWYAVWLLPLLIIMIQDLKNVGAKKIFIWLSVAPLFFYIPWMLMDKSEFQLWFSWLSVLLIVAYPLVELFKWRKNSYGL